jgi:hypothetical protein
VAPKATEGADGYSLAVVLPPLPSGCACHLPLAGEDWFDDDQALFGSSPSSKVGISSDTVG